MTAGQGCFSQKLYFLVVKDSRMRLGMWNFPLELEGVPSPLDFPARKNWACYSTLLFLWLMFFHFYLRSEEAVQSIVSLFSPTGRLAIWYGMYCQVQLPWHGRTGPPVQQRGCPYHHLGHQGNRIPWHHLSRMLSSMQKGRVGGCGNRRSSSKCGLLPKLDLASH